MLRLRRRGFEAARVPPPAICRTPHGEHDPSNAWTTTLGRWCEAATVIVGNPVNLIEVTVEGVLRRS
jgi:hypothetical protein